MAQLSAGGTHTEEQTRDRGELLIAVFKLGKAAILLFVAIGSLSILDHTLKQTVLHQFEQLGVDPGNRRIHHLLAALGLTSPERIGMFGAGSFVYAAIFAAEGIGLLAAKRWARYFTASVTASFLALEFYAIAQHPDELKAIVIALNIAIVIYLIVRIRTQNGKSSAGAPAGS